MLRVGPLDQRPLHPIVKNVDKGLSSHRIGLLDQRLHQSSLAAVELNKDLLPLLQLHRAPDQKLSKLANSRVLHNDRALPFLILILLKKAGQKDHFS